MADRVVTRDGRGFTLVELVIAMAFLGFIVLATVPLFAFAGRSVASSADLASTGSQAVRRLETLRATRFDLLPAGGSLNSNVTNYFDASDPRFVVRWTITNNATPVTRKTIVVSAQALRRAAGLPEQTTLTTVRSR